ncbi:MAG: 2-succinyl-5-enolpyruvyl-6-hydroxy-3-cyclohexene-1-carboxylic-acid synthase [Polyangiaceae bacterium]
MTTSGFSLALFARILVGILERCGVEHLVVSPGSRSTPFVLAARMHSKLKLTDVIDERSAAFLALGLSRGSRRPVALLCTSGTAAANYLPALVEARLTATPLIALTADRPVSHQDCSAPQTIDQVRLFGQHVVGSWALTPLVGSRAECNQLRRLLLSGMAAATGGPVPGPVHFNLHCDKPLEVLEPLDDDDRHLARIADETVADCPGIPDRTTSVASSSTILALESMLREEPRGIIACGFDPEWPALDPAQLARLAEFTGYPVLLDASHPLRFSCPPELARYVIAPFEPLLRLDEWKRDRTPRLILQIGRALTCAKWAEWLEDPRVRQLLVLSRRGWPDPSGRGTLVAAADPTAVVTSVLETWALKTNAATHRDPEWQRRWQHAATIGREAIERAVNSTTEDTNGMAEVSAIRTLLKAIPRGTRLVLGNSLPVRHADFLMPATVASANEPGIVAEAMRGASGIDGITSAAIGFARSDQRPTTLLVGDISFLHDVGGLWAARRLESPLAIVVVNNGGGRIFEQLPVQRAVDSDDITHWTTPHRLDFESCGSPLRRTPCARDRAHTRDRCLEGGIGAKRHDHHRARRRSR